MKWNIEIPIQLAMFNFDLIAVIIFLTLSLLWKEQRVGLFTGAMIYLLFTILWHVPIWGNL